MEVMGGNHRAISELLTLWALLIAKVNLNVMWLKLLCYVILDRLLTHSELQVLIGQMMGN